MLHPDRPSWGLVVGGHYPVDERGDGLIKIVSICGKSLFELGRGKRCTKYRAKNIDRGHAVSQHCRCLRVHIVGVTPVSVSLVILATALEARGRALVVVILNARKENVVLNGPLVEIRLRRMKGARPSSVGGKWIERIIFIVSWPDGRT